MAIASVVPLVPAWRVDRRFDYSVPEELLATVSAGNLVRVPFGGRRVRAVVVSVERREPERPLLPVAGVVLRANLVPPPLLRLHEWIALRYAAPRGRAFARAVPPRVRVAAGDGVPLAGGPEPRLAPAYAGGTELLADISGGSFGVWALRARPGEDRAELVAELVAAAGRGGGTAVVAVPEVRYGSEVLDRLAVHFPAMARVDSARGERERSEGWLRAAGGHGLAGGGRSAVLVPAPRLRLIVVDEEHHPSYKEDRSPRHDARRTAIERARLQGAVCVMVSSTPSAELGAGVRRGSVACASPCRAASRAGRPVVEVAARPADRALSPQLHARMRAALRAHEPVALLVPRRGYARTMWCGACRRSLRCPRCESAMAYDRVPRRARCPHCGHTAAVPDACPGCGAAALEFLGAGSERLAEQIARSFPRASVARMDPDVLEAAARGGVPTLGPPADIYVTTWIGTKAAIRPPATLVGVLDADALIRRPHFRASENAYQALAEMAEWAGPASEGGRLVIQSSDPGHHSIQAVVRADYDFWLDRELTARAELDYPPYSELIRITASGPRAPSLTAEIARRCQDLGGRVLGPVAVAARGSGPGEALEMLVKCRNGLEVATGLRGILGRALAGTRLSIDVDPR